MTVPKSTERVYLVILTGPVASTYLTLGLTPAEAEVLGRLVRAAGQAATEEVQPAMRLLLLDDATAHQRAMLRHCESGTLGRALSLAALAATEQAAEAAARGRYVA